MIKYVPKKSDLPHKAGDKIKHDSRGRATLWNPAALTTTMMLPLPSMGPKRRVASLGGARVEKVPRKSL